MNMNRKCHGRAKGFSLLELMLVVAIIGVLMAAVAWNLVGAGERAKRRVTMANMDTIRSALRMYNLNNNMYPPHLEALRMGALPYLSEDKALQDGWGRDFVYQTPGASGRPFDLISLGSDAQFGTEDDLNVWNMPTE